MIYQVRDWDKNFENNKSRERDECSFVCVPNKQHGMGFSRVMSEPDGAMIYGIWGLIIGACSQQKKKRNGWLTSDGHQTGTAWAPDDLALKFRRPIKEIERAIEVLISAKVGWLIEHRQTAETPANQILTKDRPTSASVVPAECPRSALERREEKEEKRREKSAAFEIPLLLQTDEFKESWQTWICHLKQKRKSLTALSASRQLNTLLDAGSPGEAIRWINNAIERNWQSIFPPSGSIPKQSKESADIAQLREDFIYASDDKKPAIRAELDRLEGKTK